MEDSSLDFTYHARQRQKQRFIPTSAVAQTVSCGNEVNFGWNNVSVHYSKNNKVVTSGNTVVTVVNNERNTRFNILKNSKKSVDSLTYQVEVKDNDHAMCELAEIYKLGTLVNRDIDKSHELYMRAALLGNSHAMCILADSYGDGTFGFIDSDLETKWMKKAADKGNVYALGVTGQRLLGECIKNKTINGSFSEETATKAMYYLEKAAAKSSTRAMWTIGNIYEHGYVREKNISKAIDYYSRAAEAGSPASVESLYKFSQRCLYSADKLEDILNRLVGYLVKSSVGMLFQIGESQLNGEVGYSKSRGLNMIAAAANSTNYEKAMLSLAKCYRDGRCCKADLRLCQYWYNRLYSLYEISAEQGNVDSVWKLGKFHMKGYVSEIDFDRAESFFEQAISMSNRSDFMFNLGRMYMNGLLGNKDPKAGEEIIKKAMLLEEKNAMKGNPVACYNIALFYVSNQYGFHSFEKAKFWSDKSVSFGNPDAELLLSEIYLNKCSGLTNIAKGLSIIEKKILSSGISFSEGFCIIRRYLDSDESVNWLKKKVELITDMDLDLYSLLTHLHSLVSEQGKTDGDLLVKNCLKALTVIEGISDYDKHHYLYRLFTKFKEPFAMFKLCEAYINDSLSNELISSVTKWMSELPELIWQADDIEFFFEGASLLGNSFKCGNFHPMNLMESAKWLCICKVHCMKQEDVTTNNSLQNLLNDYNDISESLLNSGFVASELIKLIQHFKSLFPLLCQVLCRILGDIFYGGHLVKQDIDKAILWYSEASMMNNARASLTLAQIYRCDEVKMNLYDCLRYYKLAVKQGCEKAMNELVALIDEKEEFKTHLPFLNNYQHKSRISPNIISEIVPFKKLTKYPSSSEEMYDLGMEFLNKNDCSMDCVNSGVFWLRKASKQLHYKATAELYILYKSGKLGPQVSSLADSHKFNLLKDICSVLKKEERNFFSDETQSKDNLLEHLKFVTEVLNKLNSEDIFKQLLMCINRLYSSDVIETLAQAISLCEEAISVRKKCS